MDILSVFVFVGIVWLATMNKICPCPRLESGSRGILPLILYVDASERWGVKVVPRPICLRECIRYGLNRRLDGPPKPV